MNAKQKQTSLIHTILQA